MGDGRSALIAALIGSALLATVVVVASFNYPEVDGVGSGGVPRIFSVAVVLMSLLALKKPVSELWRARHNAVEKVKTTQSWRPALSVLFFLLYVLALMMRFPGFLASTLLLLAVQCLILRKQRGSVVALLAYVIIVTGITYILFIRLLYLRI